MRENQRVALTKRLLREALMALLETRMIHEVSVTELCETAGINRTTFYKHYGTPNDILKELGSEFAMELAAIQENAGDTKTVEQLFEESCVFLYENRQTIKVLTAHNTDEEMSSRALEQLFRQAALPRMTALKQCDETDQRLLITYIASGCFSLLRTWILEDIDRTPQEIASLLYRVAARGWI